VVVHPTFMNEFGAVHIISRMLPISLRQEVLQMFDAKRIEAELFFASQSKKSGSVKPDP
jgi:hypothetical protein